MRRVRWSRIAQRDLTGIDDYFLSIDVDLANDFGRSALSASLFLLENPRAGAIVDLDARKWRIPKTSHLILYRLTTYGILILRIHHDRENWRAA